MSSPTAGTARTIDIKGIIYNITITYYGYGYRTNKKQMDEIFEKRPTKNVFENCLVEIIAEKNQILVGKQENKKMLEEIDKIIESIQKYLTVASK